MSRCVPDWDFDCSYPPPMLYDYNNSDSSDPFDVSIRDDDVAELKWDNGPAMHGLVPPKTVSSKPITSFPSSNSPNNTKGAGDFDWIHATTGTFGSQADHIASDDGVYSSVDDLVPLLDYHPHPSSMIMDALVPCSNLSRSVASPEDRRMKRAKAGVICGDTVSATGSVTDDLKSRATEKQVTFDTLETELIGGDGIGSVGGSYTQETSCYRKSAATDTARIRSMDDIDSVCHRSQRTADEDGNQRKENSGKSLSSTRRSRAAAIHNQSERKRRDKINQRMKTLQKLIPNSSKTDKASMLDEVIEYVKKLQTEVQMNKTNMQPLMLPMAMQQRLPMPVMSPLGVRMGMGVIDLNSIAHPASSLQPLIQPSLIMPLPTWDASVAGDRLPTPSVAAVPDALPPFMATPQPLTAEAYHRMVTFYHHQLHQSTPKT